MHTLTIEKIEVTERKLLGFAVLPSKELKTYLRSEYQATELELLNGNLIRYHQLYKGDVIFHFHRFKSSEVLKLIERVKYFE